MKKSLIFTIVIVFVVSINANERPNSPIVEQEIEVIVQQIEKLTKSGDRGEELFYMLILGARELYNYQSDEKAYKYYQKAANLDLDVDKTEVYISLISLSFQKEDKKKVQKSFKQAKEYFSSHEKYKTDEVDIFLATVEKYLSDDQSEKIEPNFFHTFLSDNRLSKFIDSGKYGKALAMMNPEGLKDSDIGTKTTYDLLRVLVVGRDLDPSGLFCSESYARFPNSYSYSMKICGAIHEYIKKGEVSSSRKNDLKAFFDENYQNKSYLLKAVHDLK